MTLEEGLEKIGEVVIEHGLEAIAKWLVGNAREDEVLELLDAQYSAARAAADAEAKAILDAEGLK